ncbi:MAG: esterase-like activity of phytase family protein [Rhodobacterales bacterium]|nr:esterase-like activity of phytase family protein [Rhodobacterales bacterium]
MAEGEDLARPSSAEIIAASDDGMTLIYTDSPLVAVGLIDITDPAAPKALGNIDMGGEPTSVTVIGKTAFVAVNTSEGFTNPSGFVAAIDLATKAELGRCDLGGQPDGTAHAADGSFIAIAIENERDEDAGDGRTGQMPAGWVTLIDTNGGTLNCDTAIRADLIGLAEVSPEGVIAIPERGLIATANELDLIEDGGPRSHAMIYQLTEGAPVYPMLTTAGAAELIGWGALSGLVADPAAPGTFYAVNDSFYGFQPTIFTIDATQTPARITAALPITRAGYPAQKLDIEGITLDGEGGFWLASEGRTDRMIPHGIYHVESDGNIDTEIAFPSELLTNEDRYGAEGIALVGTTLWLPIQREWADDPEGQVKIVAYNLETEEWGAVRYPLTAPTGDGWVGLSEIAVSGDYAYLIERDNLFGSAAVTKTITRVPLSDMVPAPLGGDLPVVTKEVVSDLLPDLASTGGPIIEKVEGLAIDADGNGWVVTDNDGVDDASGETMFWTIGKL